ncbi:MAG: hypothetical protein VX085_15935, partial [Pseudomonadota bacterium]|nr:hypothetical protein [Pseudomonadota bacterium]
FSRKEVFTTGSLRTPCHVSEYIKLLKNNIKICGIAGFGDAAKLRRQGVPSDWKRLPSSANSVISLNGFVIP